MKGRVTQIEGASQYLLDDIRQHMILYSDKTVLTALVKLFEQKSTVTAKKVKKGRDMERSNVQSNREKKKEKRQQFEENATRQTHLKQ